METIYRYQLPIADRPVITMPIGARVLPHPPSNRNNDTIEIWAEVDPDAPPQQREFLIIGTGNPLPRPRGDFIGTTMIHQGLYVWHVYEAA